MIGRAIGECAIQCRNMRHNALYSAMSSASVLCQISRPVDSECGPFAGFAIEVAPFLRVIGRDRLPDLRQLDSGTSQA